jgi:O-antigen/teichoic acid export membrane protein
VAAPLLVFSSALQLHTKVDLFALSALGGTAIDTGLYSAAQNLAVPPSLFALGFAPLLLATLGRLERTGQHDDASETARLSLRLCLALIPLAAIVAGASGEVVPLIFGAAFTGAAPLLALLFAATVALALTAICVSIVTASSRASGVSRNVTMLGALLVVSAVVLHLFLIPRMGPNGAATATALSAVLSAIAGLAMVHYTWRVHVYATAVRMLLTAAPIFWVASNIPTTAWWSLVLKFVLLSFAIITILLLLGEFSAADKRRFRALLPAGL